MQLRTAGRSEVYETSNGLRVPLTYGGSLEPGDEVHLSSILHTCNEVSKNVPMTRFDRIQHDVPAKFIVADNCARIG